MAIRTLQPENKTKRDFGQIGMVAGGIAGGVLGGGPGGALAGAGAGQQIGTTVGGLLDPDKPQISEIGSRGSMDPAMARRQSALETGGQALSAARGIQGFGDTVGAQPSAPDMSNTIQTPPAMQRRMDSPTNTLIAAESALSSLSQEDQNRYGPALRQARLLDKERMRGYG